MPDISTEGKSYAVGFWNSELCDNSLALYPEGDDFSWGENSFEIDGCDSDNYVEVAVIDENGDVLKSFIYTTNGRKELDLSQYLEISSTQDIHIRMKITTYI